MITADETKTLYDQSGAEVDKYLHHKIEPEIKAATSGNRTVFHFIGSRDVFTHPCPDPVQTGIIEKPRARSDTLSGGWNLKANRMCREALLMMLVMVLPTPTTVFGSLGKEISLLFRSNLV